MEGIAEWMKIAMAWLFISAVLVSGLAAFGLLLVSLCLVRGITTIHRHVKSLTHRDRQ